MAVDTDKGDSLAVGAGCAALAIGAAAALVPLRTTLGAANIALIMVLVVVLAAALGGRVGGAVTAVAASIAFNFFHTKPYLTVRIDHPRDMATVLLILAVGVAVGELGVARARQSATRRSHLRSIRSLEEVGALVSAGSPVESVWPAVRDALVTTLGLRRARFDAYVHHPIPVIERDGRVDVTRRRYVGDGFALARHGRRAERVERRGVPRSDRARSPTRRSVSRASNVAPRWPSPTSSPSR